MVKVKKYKVQATISFFDDVIKWIDSMVLKRKYESRSHAINTILRERMNSKGNKNDK